MKPCPYSLKYVTSLVLSIALVVPPALGQTSVQQPAASRPGTMPARPGLPPRPQSPPAINRPATLPSYPDRPQAERPRPPRPPQPPRPGANRPVTLPSYPDRPHAERPRPRPPIVRPPIVRPPYRPHWGYVYPGGGMNFAGTIRCESFGYRFRSCYVPTRGRVVLERRHNGRCRYGNGWGYDRTRIWVDNNCRATFAYGIGGYIPRYRSDSDAALIIGGVVIAAGLVAILSNSGDGGKNEGSYPPAQTAIVVADLGDVDAKARPGMRVCLDRAASNVGATGGSKVQLTGVTIDNLGGGSYRYDTDLRATYPGKARALSYSCTAKGDQVEDFDFITDG